MGKGEARARRGALVEPIPTVTLGTGTCEEQLAYAGQIFYGLVSSYFAARDLLEECRALVIAEGDTATDQELANALAFSGPGPQPALQPTAPCEDRLQVAQSLIRGLVDIFDNRFIPAMVLCAYFLRPRTDRPEASDLLNRMRNFLVTANATILGAARNFLPPIVR